MQLRGLGGFNPAGAGMILRDRLDVQVDGYVVLRGDIREQQQQRVIRGGVFVFVQRRGRKREMLRRQFAKAGYTFAKEFFRLFLELPLNFRAGVARSHRFLNHAIQAAAATENAQSVRIFFRDRQ